MTSHRRKIEQKKDQQKNSRKKWQIAFFVTLLILVIFVLYRFNLLPFRSNILAKERVNVLAVGTDQVENTGRADTILILSINPKNKDTFLFSIPRDMRVYIPDKGMDKINHAYAYGGIELLEQSIETFLGIPVHYYGIMDFEGFEQLIDTLGGVEINVEKDMHYIDEAGSLSIDLKNGPQVLNGEKALQYVRFRYDAQGDLGRIQRQQKLINALIEKVLHFNIVVKLPGIIADMSKYIKTNMNYSDIVSLARLLKNIDKDEIWLETIHGKPCYIDGISYLSADSSEVQKRIQYLFNNELRGLNIEVLNGNKVPGIAHQVAQKMEELGFDVVNIDNADHFDYENTVVIIYSKQLKIEHYLKQYFNNIKIVHQEKPESQLDMTIIIGKNMLY